MNYNDTDPNWKIEEYGAIMKNVQRIKTTENERENIDGRAKFQNLSRCVHHQRVEDAFYDSFTLDAEQQKRYADKVRANELLAKDLDRQRDGEMASIKRRQWLRENTVELRELESQLRTAYVTKSLTAQLAEKEYIRLAEKKREKETSAMVQRALLSDLEAEKKEEAEEIQRKHEYKKDLQDQMILNHQLKENKYEEFLREKKFLDSIIQQIYEEDQREMEDKMCKRNRTRDEIEAFKIAQSIWKEKEKQELQEENKKIEMFLKEKEAKDDAMRQEKLERIALRANETDAIGMKIYAEEQERKDKAALVQSLLEEEHRAMDEERVKRELQNEVQRRLEQQYSLAIQIDERKQKQKQEELEDIQYREQQLAKILEDERLEQMSAEKKRRKMIALRRDIEDNIKERRAKRAEEMKQLVYLDEQDKIVAEQKRKIIEEERMRMLKEHAIHLIGYIPPRVLRADDLPHLGPEVEREYKHL